MICNCYLYSNIERNAVVIIGSLYKIIDLAKFQLKNLLLGKSYPYSKTGNRIGFFSYVF